MANIKDTSLVSRVELLDTFHFYVPIKVGRKETTLLIIMLPIVNATRHATNIYLLIAGVNCSSSSSWDGSAIAYYCCIYSANKYALGESCA